MARDRSDIWNVLSPTHDEQLKQILNGEAPPEMIEHFQRKYAQAVALQAKSTASRIGLQGDRLEGAVQEASSTFATQLPRFRFRPDGQDASFRRFLCGMIRNLCLAHDRTFGTENARIAAAGSLLLGELGADATPAPTRVTRELDHAEYLGVLRESLDEWLARNPTGRGRFIYDAMIALFAEKGFDPDARSVNVELSARTGLRPKNIATIRYRIRCELDDIVDRALTRRLDS